jgi:hypothetical protein
LKNCLNCDVLFKHGRNTLGLYCSNKCQQELAYKKNIQAWKAGTKPGWVGKTKKLAVWLRKFILERDNFACVKCTWNKRHNLDGLPLVEVNHIDGNAENCKEENLETLCPCCHSETPNFRRRNSKSTRIRYAPSCRKRQTKRT